jgi:hypothetical protein
LSQLLGLGYRERSATKQRITMSEAILNAESGETIKIHFSTDPYVKGTAFIATPGSGGAASTKAMNIRVTLEVSPGNTLPERVLVKLHADPEYGWDREHQFILLPTEDKIYSGHLDRRLVISSADRGRWTTRHQHIEFALIQDGREDWLVDPVTGLTRFQINLDHAALAG